MLERHSAVVDAALKATETPTEPAQGAAVSEPGAADIARRSVPPSTAERTASGIAATPCRAVEASEANRPVRASPRAPPAGPSAAGSPANWACRGGRCSAICGVRRARPGASGGRAGPGWTAPGVDRRPDRRGLDQRRRVAPAVDRTRFQRVLRQRLCVRHEAARRRREEARAAQRGQAAGPGAAVGEATLLRVGPPNGETQASRTARLDAIRACERRVAAALDLADGFADLIRKQSARPWASGWLEVRPPRTRTCGGSPKASVATRRLCRPR